MPEGKRKRGLTDYMQLLLDDSFEVLPFCQASAEWLAKERVVLAQKGVTVTKYDCEIAAVGVVNQLTLVTNNTSDFLIFDELEVVSWH